MTRRPRRSKTFAVCINNAGYQSSLEAGKLYEVIPDQKAEKHGLVRVVDESGEDYGYAAERFFMLAVPLTLKKALSDISPSKQPNPALRPHGARAAKAAMKKQTGRKAFTDKDTMRPEYDFSKGVRGKHATQYAEGTRVVVVKRTLHDRGSHYCVGERCRPCT